MSGVGVLNKASRMRLVDDPVILRDDTVSLLGNTVLSCFVTVATETNFRYELCWRLVNLFRVLIARLFLSVSVNKVALLTKMTAAFCECHFPFLNFATIWEVLAHSEHCHKYITSFYIGKQFRNKCVVSQLP